MSLRFRDAHRQVLGSFDPAAATLEQAKASSYELKALEIKKELQGYKISRGQDQGPSHYPVYHPDSRPLERHQRQEAFMWAWVWRCRSGTALKRIRNVSRQKAVLKQIGAEKDEKEIGLTDKWNDLQEDIQEQRGRPENCPVPGRTGPAEGAPERNPLPFRRGAPPAWSG